jgi:hypothetical protein
MMKQPIPHSPEWFAALDRQNPMQAAQTRTAIKAAGSDEVCSVCGDDPANDYQLAPGMAPEHAVVSLRLCDDCFEIRSMSGEKFVPLER